jgi:tRNA A-37 threonylcarbamoyl transferase component Bud32
VGDGRSSDADDQSWTDMEDARPDLVEVVPVRHGMVLGGRYVIEKIIGRGGSGVVVRAHDRDLKEVVAIKIVRAELAGQRVWAERLAREVKLARQIHHPHVCRVFDFEQAEGRVFLVMELAERGTLRDEIRSGALAARPLAERIADARAVASALAAIHAAGIVHRDLTPQNLLRMGDGRLVLSDFGLATDASEGTSSVHGGTVAYMAPEVVRGGRSSVASDIWALGVVMHEIVFGEKPRWSDAATSEMLVPELGRKLTPEERAVLEACRACTARDPGKRVASAEEAGQLLTGHRRWRPLGFGSWRRPVLVASVAVALIAALAIGRRRQRTAEPRVAESPLIVPTGKPADWTDVSTVLAEIPERILCMVGLPDKHTVRFVWGRPARSEDVDTRTRRRFPSPLVPEAYAEGCPDLSPDGTRLLYQGHVKDGRAFAFVSPYPDGREGRSIVAIAEPTHVSEPKWLADGKSFSYDLDTRHIGIFSLETNRGVVVPERDDSHVGSFRWTIGNQVFLQKIFIDKGAEFVGHVWPSLVEVLRFRVPDFCVDLRSADGSTYYYTNANGDVGPVVALTPASRSARQIGFVREQFIRHPVFVESGLAFVSAKATTSVDARPTAVARDTISTGAFIRAAVACDGGLLMAEKTGETTVINRRTFAGNLVSRLTEGPEDHSPSCSSDGRVWCYVKDKPSPGVVRCDGQGCTQIIDRPALAARISPDGSRIIFVSAEKRGLAIYVSAGDGTGIREVRETETFCSPGWSSLHAVWLSRRRGELFVWTEVDIDSNRETGRTTAGTTECSNGDEDPASPVNPDVRVVVQRQAQVRVLAQKYLSH